MITDTQVFAALVIALISGLFAIRLGQKLYVKLINQLEKIRLFILVNLEERFFKKKDKIYL